MAKPKKIDQTRRVVLGENGDLDKGRGIALYYSNVLLLIMSFRYNSVVAKPLVYTKE